MIPATDNVLIPSDDQDPGYESIDVVRGETLGSQASDGTTHHQFSQGQPTEPTNRSGETSISGDHPDLESDDNVLDAAQRVGLYGEASEEDPHEVNVAQEVDEAEQAWKEEQPQ